MVTDGDYPNKHSSLFASKNVTICRHIMKSWIVLFTVFLASVVGSQEVAPKAGETILRLSIESRGVVSILLHTRSAPKTTARIIQLAEQKFYDGQRFFKVMKSPKPFLVQIGDPMTKEAGADLTKAGAGGTGTTVPFEDSGNPNVLGAVGLAAKPDNRDSGDSQFYILLGPSRFLDGQHTVFGQVVGGIEVLKRIELGDRITSATIVRG